MRCTRGILSSTGLGGLRQAGEAVRIFWHGVFGCTKVVKGETDAARLLSLSLWLLVWNVLELSTQERVPLRGRLP